MFFELTETDIKNKLTADLGVNIEVEILPESQAAYKRALQKPKVDICYQKSTYQNPRIPHNIIQDEVMSFEIVITAKLRRGTNGIYDVFEKVRRSIIGFTPRHCRQIYAKSFGLERYEDNLWHFSFVVECESTLVENFTEYAGPNITEINFIEL